MVSAGLVRVSVDSVFIPTEWVSKGVSRFSLYTY